MESFEWTITVIGAVLCVLYGWCLHTVAGKQTIWICKIGPIIGMVGTVVLAGMAMSDRADVVGKERVIPAYTTNVIQEQTITKEIPENRIRWENKLSVSGIMHKVEPRPSKSHIAHADEKGRLSWVSKEDYKILVEKRRKGGG